MGPGLLELGLRRTANKEEADELDGLLQISRCHGDQSNDGPHMDSVPYCHAACARTTRWPLRALPAALNNPSRPNLPAHLTPVISLAIIS